MWYFFKPHVRDTRSWKIEKLQSTLSQQNVIRITQIFHRTFTIQSAQKVMWNSDPAAAAWLPSRQSHKKCKKVLSWPRRFSQKLPCQHHVCKKKTGFQINNMLFQHKILFKIFREKADPAKFICVPFRVRSKVIFLKRVSRTPGLKNNIAHQSHKPEKVLNYVQLHQCDAQNATNK